MPLTYRDSGVDVAAGRSLAERIQPAVKRTQRPEVIENPGGFSALTRLPSDYVDPILVSSTDGVGTKIDLLIQQNQVDAVGFDLVAMCVNDVLVYGAEPMIFLDYYASSKLDVDLAATVVNSIARACEYAGCALVGGETAEMPGFYPHGKFDLAGFCVGVAERDRLLDPNLVQDGDILIGLESSGPHSNGYSLIRKLMETAALPPPDILDQLLASTTIYVPHILPIVEDIQSAAHITGGGFGENLPRAFSGSLAAIVDLDTWARPACFDWIQGNGAVEELEMLNTFNCGIGMVVFCRKEKANRVLETLRSTDIQAHVIGHMTASPNECQEGSLFVSGESTRLM